MDNFTTSLIRFKSATIALLSAALFLLLISSMTYWFYKGTAAVKQPTNVTTAISVPDSIEVSVDLNDYLEVVDYSTDWNYTEIGQGEMEILQANGIYYSQNGYWARKISNRGGN